MGVYNPLAEMPRGCVVCVYRYSCPLFNQNAYWLSSFKHKDCPLVEVKTPHGRLIDGDLLVEQHEKVKQDSDSVFSYQFHILAPAWVKQAPTIIEAEGKNDE